MEAESELLQPFAHQYPPDKSMVLATYARACGTAFMTPAAVLASWSFRIARWRRIGDRGWDDRRLKAETMVKAAVNGKPIGGRIFSKRTPRCPRRAG